MHRQCSNIYIYIIYHTFVYFIHIIYMWVRFVLSVDVLLCVVVWLCSVHPFATSKGTQLHSVYRIWIYTTIYSLSLQQHKLPQDNMMVVVGGGLGERWIRPFWVSHFRLSPASHGLQATRPTKQHSMAQPPPIITLSPLYFHPSFVPMFFPLY